MNIEEKLSKEKKSIVIDISEGIQDKNGKFKMYFYSLKY